MMMRRRIGQEQLCVGIEQSRHSGIGVQGATVLVHEAFVREFANGKALGSYTGLAATPFSSGGTERGR